MFYDEYIKLCNQIKKSPSAVAEELGFQKSAVTRWKQGSTPTDSNKRKIAEYFGVPISMFLQSSQTVPEKPVATAKPAPLSPPPVAPQERPAIITTAPAPEHVPTLRKPVWPTITTKEIASASEMPAPAVSAPIAESKPIVPELKPIVPKPEPAPVPKPSPTSQINYDKRTALKMALFGDKNIGDDLLDDVLSYAKFRQSLISRD